MPETLTPKWLTLEQAQQYCGLNARTIQNHIKAGLIRSANVTAPGASRGRRLVDRVSLDEFIEGHVGAPPSKLKMHSPSFESHPAAR
jgi:hypothetical protein